MASEVEECIKRLVAHKGVQQVVIVNYEGIPIRTYPAAMEHMDAVRASGVFLPLVTKVCTSRTTAYRMPRPHAVREQQQPHQQRTHPHARARPPALRLRRAPP